MPGFEEGENGVVGVIVGIVALGIGVASSERCRVAEQSRVREASHGSYRTEAGNLVYNSGDERDWMQKKRARMNKATTTTKKKKKKKPRCVAGLGKKGSSEGRAGPAE